MHASAGYSVIVDYRDIDALPGIVLDQTQVGDGSVNV
jgi:hypothetical protein